jgi:hypothetical protein
MSLWGAAVGGLTGTFVLTTILRSASELRLTRIDLPFLLHFAAGLLFSMAYYVGFVVLDRSGWRLGAAFGLIHGLFAGSALVNILLPIVHPRMGTPMSSIHSTALLEPPGFMMMNYGRSTPLVSLAAHVVFGAIVGAFTAAAS